MDEAVVSSLALVHSTNPREKEGALRMLINKTLQENVRKEVLSDMGTFTFIELLQSDSDVILMLSAWLLSHIAIDDRNCGILLSSGVLRYMVPLLASENTDVIEKTLWVVNNLLTSGIREHMIGKFSIITSLTSLLRAPSHHIIFTSCNILKNLMRKDSCQDFEENQKVFVDQKGLQVLAKQLEPVFPPFPHKTFLAVISLTHVFTLYEPTYRLLLAEEGVTSTLVKLIATPTTPPDIREHALRVLYNISLEESALKYLVENSALPALISFVLSTNEIRTNPNMLGLSILILANGVLDEELRTSLRQVRDFGAALFKLGSELVNEPQTISDPSNNESQAFMEVIANASCDEILRYQLQSSPDINRVVEKVIAVVQDPHFQEIAASALENLNIPVEQSVIQMQGIVRDDSLKSVLDLKIKLSNSGKIFKNLEYERDPIIQRIVSELFVTEQTYVYNLGLLVRVFLAKVTDSNILPTAHINKIFLNVKVLYQLHKDLLKSMGNRVRENPEQTCLGDVITGFWDHTRAIEEYRTFVTHFDNAQMFSHQLSNKMPTLKKLLHDLMYHRETQGLSLFSYMIQPIQRIPRYILMLEDINKQLPKNDPDSAKLQEALIRTKKVAETLNEAKRVAEASAKAREIQEKLVDVPKGFVLLGLQECIMDGLLVEDRLFGSRHIHMFLFPDVLMCTFPKKKMLKIEYIIKLRDLSKVIISEERGTQQTVMHLRWKDKEERDLNLYLSKIEAREWYDAIEKAKVSLYNKSR
jgi:hypothetical protein